MKTAIGIRFYSSSADNLDRLKSLVESVSTFADFILIAVKDDIEQSVIPEIEKWNASKTKAVSVGKQEKFVPILNFMVKYVYGRGFDRLLFVSAEIELTKDIFFQLSQHLDEQTLVAGAVLAGHEFRLGENRGSGETVPWNTLAMWNLDYLARTGFPLAGEAPYDSHFAGVEEIGACAVLQSLYPDLKIKLVNLGAVKWHIEELSNERIADHIKKLESKERRAEKQLKFLELPTPKVLHIEG